VFARRDSGSALAPFETSAGFPGDFSMSANLDNSAADWPSAPPTSAGPLPSAVRSPAWPTVIGVIAIVFGVLGAIGGLWGVVGLAVMRRFGFGLWAKVEVADAVRGWAAWTIPLSAVAAVLGLMLLAGGVGLLRRRRWARTALVRWASLKIPLVVASGMLGWLVQQQVWQTQSSVMAAGGGFPQTAVSSTAVAAFATFGLVLGTIWGWALPVFVLIWFARGPIKAQVSTWDTADQ
jgi:hypothetical protein